MKRGPVLLVAIAFLMLLATAAVAYAYTPTTPYDSADCLECHQVTNQAPVSRVDFTVGKVNYQKCKTCHQAPGQWPGISAPGDGHWHKRTYCESCHDGYYAFGLQTPGGWPLNVFTNTLTPYGYFLSSTSPSATPSTLHTTHRGGHWVEYELSPSFPYCSNCHGNVTCTSCHDPIAHDSHAVSQYPGPVTPQANGSMYVSAPLNCVNDSCHPYSKQNTPAWVPLCTSCHEHDDNVNFHGYDATKHTADVTDTVDGGGKKCGDCHKMDLSLEHSRASSSAKNAECAACHPTPRDTFTSWNQTCQQGGCHPAGSPTAAHASITASHAVLTSGAPAQCLGCHPGSDLSVMHADATSTVDASITSCLVCHSTSAVPTSKDCTVCHFPMASHPAADHSAPNSSACAGTQCHDTADAAANHPTSATDPTPDCAKCHQNPTRVPVLPDTADCAGCHEPEVQPHYSGHAASPALMDGTVPKYAFYTGSAASGLYTSACAGCHTSNLMDEHLGSVATQPRRDRTGAVLTCATCHESSDPVVMQAIALGKTSCESCHENGLTHVTPGVHGPIETQHTSTFKTAPEVPCSPCHKANIVSEHNGGRSWPDANGQPLVYCDVCHANYADTRGAEVQAAIEDTNDVKCTACHDVQTGHPDKGGHYASATASVGCATGVACHGNGSSPVDIRTVHADASAGPCAVCHENPGRVPDITAKTAECASCHSAYHTGIPAKHTYSAMPATCQSPTCHVRTLPEAHAEYIAGQTTYATGCELCHANQVPGRIPADATAACSSCHSDIHPNPDHTADNSQGCVDCHETADVLTLHAGRPEGACDVCHANPGRVPTLPADVECDNCHDSISPADPNHYYSKSHTAGDGTAYGYACSTCHKLGMKPEHAKPSSGPVNCVTCHETKVDAFAGPWDKSCSQCHTTALHADYGGKHVSGSTDCAGSTCHDVSDVSTLHASAETTFAGISFTSCRVCHRDSSYVPNTTTCTDCHAGHGDLTAKHTATNSTECTGCHASGNAYDLHKKADGTTDCALCHDNPDRVPTLPTTVDCVNCHDYSPVYPEHYNETTHTVSSTSDWSGSENYGGRTTACSSCHTGSMQPAHSAKWTASASCLGCHTAKPAVVANWDRNCSACHSVKHAAITTAHAGVPPSGNTCLGTGCHANNSTDLVTVHKDLAAGCAIANGNGACHVAASKDSKPTTKTCVTCHPGKTDQHVAHNYTAASDYSATTNTGCTNSGTGCHGSDSAYEAKKYHPTCAGCHGSSSFAGYSAANFECVNCHNANYSGAPDTIALTDKAPNGHYGETTHTATAMTRVVSAGGTASAACSDCHDVSLYPAHSSMSSSSGYGSSLVCGECHNDTHSNGNAQVLANWTNDKCDDCHTVSSSAIMHSATSAPVVTASSSLGCLTGGSMCHVQTDLHALHKDALSCGIDGCHQTKNVKPTSKTCGAGNACHTDKADGTHGAGGEIVEPYSYCTDAGCHTLATQVHDNAAHPKQCASCHGLPAEQQCICHTKTEVHAVTAHPADCAKCHPSGTSMPHGNITLKLTTPSAWSAACDDCHGSVHNRGEDCSRCHSLSGLHSEDSDHVNSNGDCKHCHNIPTVDLTDPCLTCHPGGKPAEEIGTEDPFTNCSDCHGSTHNSGQDCTRCHSATSTHGVSSHDRYSCSRCHGVPTNGTGGSSPGEIYEPYGGCTDCHPVTVDVHRQPSHPKECVDCHGKTDACTTCHTATVIHPVPSHNVDCTKCHTSGAPSPGPVAEPFTACDDCHGYSGIHNESAHSGVNCFTCHSATPGCMNTGCHTQSNIHGEGAHTNAGCTTCHTSGITKPHQAVTSKLGTSDSNWKTVCGSCHGGTHDRGQCYDCHAPNTTSSSSSSGGSSGWGSSGWGGSGYGNEDVHAVGSHMSNSRCPKCHTVATADLTLDCLSCHPNGQSVPTAPAAYGSIAGAVKLADGTPIAGVVVSASNSVTTAVTAADGSYRLSGVLIGTGIQVKAAKPGYATVTNTVTVSKGQQTTSNFTLAAVPTGSVSGKVTVGGTALAGVKVVILSNGYTATTDALGNYSFPKVEYGTFTVRCMAPDYVDNDQSVVVSGPGPYTVNFAMSKLSNIALNKTATTSSNYSSSYTGAKAVDGSTATYWRSGGRSSTEWLSIDLGAPYDLQKTVTKWNGSYWPRSFEIQVSMDNSTWTKVWSASSSSSAITTETISGAIATGRYVRVYCTSANSSSIYQLQEFQVLAQPAKPGTVSGVVTSGGSPLAGATVTLSGGAGTATTAANGSYSISAPPGAYTVTFAKTNYTTVTQAVTLASGGTATADAAMVMPSYNAARGKTFTTSKSATGYEAAKAGDGSTSTYWGTGSLSSTTKAQWLMTDLGAATAINKVVVNWGSSSYYARAYTVQTSADGVTWSTIYSTTSNTSSSTRTITFTTANVRYVRVNCNEYNSSSGYRIYELEAWTP